MSRVIKESRNGIWYYADPSVERATYMGRRYNLVLWRDTLATARSAARGMKMMAARGSIVRKIAFHRGEALTGGHKGKWTIYCYGVYARQ